MRKAPIVEEIHEVRAKLLAECGGDLDKYFDRLKAMEAKDPERLIAAEEFRKLKEQSEKKAGTRP